MRSSGGQLARSVVFISLQQVFARVVPFALHTFAKTSLDPAVASLGSVRFPLLLAVAYAVGRDGVRRACLRAGSERSLHAAMRALLPISFCLTLASTGLVVALTWPDGAAAGAADYRRALWIYALALAIEALSESCYIPALWRGHVVRESFIEVAARAADALAFWASVAVKRVSCGPAAAFARGQLAYAATLAALYAAVHLTDSALAPRTAPLLDTVKAADTGAPQTAEELQNVGTEAGVSVPVTDRPAGFASRAMARHAARCGAEVAVVQAAAAFTWQACQKMLLQEATRIALSTYSAHVAGVYGEVQNLGSLAVRLVFWPVETSAFRVFSRCPAHAAAPHSSSQQCSASEHASAAPQGDEGATSGAACTSPLPAGGTAQGALRQRAASTAAPGGDVAVEQRRRPATAAATAEYNAHHLPLLQALHRFVLLVAAVAAVFGPNYAFTAVHVLLSRRWSATEAPALLASYSVFLITLAVNGVTEAYAHARMTGAQLARANGFLAAVTAAQAAAMVAAHAAGRGSHALVALDAASMAARIAYSYRFVWRLHGGTVGGLWLWVPSAGSSGALGVAYVILRASNARMQSRLVAADLAAGAPRVPGAMLAHVGTGAAVLACLLAVLVATERALIAKMRGAIKQHSD